MYTCKMKTLILFTFRFWIGEGVETDVKKKHNFATSDNGGCFPQ